MTWDDQAYVETFIKAAVDSGQPPSAVILSDPERTQWTETDYRLVKAYYLKQNMMSGSFPVWIDRSDRISFEVKSFISKSEAALERRQEQDNKNNAVSSHGKRYYAVPQTMDGGPMPTMQEYLEAEAEKKGDRRPGRPQG